MKRSLFRAGSIFSPGESRYLLTVFFLLLAAFAGISSPAWGQDFIPKISYYRGDFDLEFYHERDDEKYGTDQSSLRTETDFIEKITLSASGFVYHPRFIVFSGKLTLGALQSKYQTSANDDRSWKMQDALGYDFRMIVLPEHPYNFELHSLRQSYITRALAGVDGSIPVYQNHGASFEYKKKPYYGRVFYDITDTGTSAETVGQILGVSAGYIGAQTTTSAAYSRSRATTTGSGFSADNGYDTYSLYNRTGFKKYRLTSRLDLDKYEQTSSHQSFLNTDRLTIDELLEIALPWNFSSEVRYRHDKFDSETDDGKTSSSADRLSGMIKHQLFRSLDTSYTLSYDKLSYEAAETKRLSHYVSLFYSKQIPWGTLSSGVNLGLATSDNKGTPIVAGEVYNAALLADFVLKSSNIDQIFSVDVKDPVSGLFFPLSPGSYHVTKMGSTTVLTILTVPAEVVNPDPFFVYEFQVAYKIIPEDVTLEERTMSFNLNLSLFEGAVSPYYSHTTYRQDVVSGISSVEPFDGSTDTLGVTLRRDPYTLRLEAQNARTTHDSTKRAKADLYYDRAVSPTVKITANANYYLDRYNNDDIDSSITFIETGGGVGFQKAFTRLRMNLNSTVHVDYRSGEANGYAYSLNSNLNWNIRRTNIVLGAVLNHFETESSFLKDVRDYQYFYLKLSRQLF